MALSPKTEALAFRIWAYATPRGWNCTIAEIAEALCLDWHETEHVLLVKNWRKRVPFQSRKRAPSRETGPRRYGGTAEARAIVRSLVGDVSGMPLDSDGDAPYM